jgi:hypothetical protein
MVASTKGLGPEKDCVGKTQQHIQKTDPSPRQRGRPTKQDHNCQIVIYIWTWAPDGTRHQDLLTDWPSVAMWLWLWEESVAARSWESSVEEGFFSCCRELGRVLEMAAQDDWEEMARNELDTAKLQWDGYISVARLRLLKIENPSACVMVNCKVCKSAIALYCLWSRVVNV